MPYSKDFSGKKPAKLPETTTVDLFRVSGKSINAAAAAPVLVEEPAEPLSIIYKSQVNLFDVPAEKAKEILEFANGTYNYRAIIKAQAAAEPEAMSIICKGEVYVFIDVPAAKANQILELARRCAHGHKCLVASRPSSTNRLNLSSTAAPSTARHFPLTRRPGMKLFLEKRKERISENAPYKTSDPVGFPSKPVESKPLLVFGARSQH